MNFIIVFIIIHGNTIHNAVVDGIFSCFAKMFFIFWYNRTIRPV